MPSLSFKEQDGKPIAYITVTKEQIKAKPELKAFNNKIIYLHDHANGVKEIDLKDISVFPLLKSKEGEKQNNRVAIFGKSGSGKSHLVGRMLDMFKSKRFGDPEREIVIISGVEEDPALDKPRGPRGEKTEPERIDIYSPEFAEMDISDFENCVVVYDDVEMLSNKVANRQVLNLRNAIQVHQLTTYLTKYAGLSKQAIEKINEIGENKSRWLYVSNLAPMYVIHEKGAYLIK